MEYLVRNLNRTKEAFKEVYAKKKYFLITFSAASFLFSLNAVARNYRILLSDFSVKLLLSLITGIFTSFSTGALTSLVAISLLTGIVVSFTVFLLGRQISSGLSFGASGIAMAILAPACPSCALGILGIFGLGGLFAFLPFGGLELGLLSVVLLVFSIFYLSKKITVKVCEMK